MKNLAVLFLILIFSCVAFAQKKAFAENFSAVAMDGQTVELSSLRGKVVIISFWTTRCPICHEEIPKLNQLAAQYKNKNVVFLGLTTDNEEKVASYVKKNPFNFNLVPNSFGILLKYAEKDRAGNILMGYPAHFVINQEGEIELRTSGFDKTAKLDSEINRLLASK
ncbi:MAG TPA: TlpA disulfide reductase family protein [Pyrinomonadaceae bacterium]|jgi:peroxiredoxin